LQLFEILHFDFNQGIGIEKEVLFDDAGDRAVSGDMIFLDENGVVQTDAVVLAAAAGDCVFLCQT
jgi:hypothetical protein